MTPEQTPIERMIEYDLIPRGIWSARVIGAMRKVAREEFVKPGHRNAAYADCALPIDAGQTISQPYVVAAMLQALDIKPTDKALEIGAGSGYAATVMSKLAAHVTALEIEPMLAHMAKERVRKLAPENVTVINADGHMGWAEGAPYDVIMVSAATDKVPDALRHQLSPGGRMVIPVGPIHNIQQLVLLLRDDKEKWHTEPLFDVRFVPLKETSNGGPPPPLPM